MALILGKRLRSNRASSQLPCERTQVCSNRRTNAPTLPDVPPPNPKPSPSQHPIDVHGEPPRQDPFRWLQAGFRDPRVLQYLHQENEYSKIKLRQLQPLRQQLEQEIAELSWRHALMLAAQQVDVSDDVQQRRYGDFRYLREPVAGSSTRFRHLRIPLRQAAVNAAQSGRGLSAIQLPPADATTQLAFAVHPAVHPDGSSPPLPAQEAVVVMDEERRAVACPSPSVYTMHSFAPSPGYELAAFTEAVEKVPEGHRMPDRFTLHVVDAVNGEPVIPPLHGVSGDVGWVSLHGATGLSGGSASSGEEGRTGDVVTSGRDDGFLRQTFARLYITRGAQRELWYLDIPITTYASGMGPASEAPMPAALAAPAATGSKPSLTATASRLEPSPSFATAVAAPASPRLAFRDPDGQPIQLVQYGRHLYGETLGNAAVPLEIRWLGATCATDAPTAAAVVAGLTPGGAAELRRVAGGGGQQGGAVPTAAAIAEGGRVPPCGRAGCGATAGGCGVPLLPRALGRQYSAHAFRPLPGGLEGWAAAAGGGLRPLACGEQGALMEPLGRKQERQRKQQQQQQQEEKDGKDGKEEEEEEIADSVVLWVRDLQRPNGCLLLLAPPARSELTQPGPLLELLPHDPALRILHVEARAPDAVLCVRVAVDAAGDPLGRYDVCELGVEWRAVRRRAAAAAVSALEGRELRPGTQATAGPSRAEAAGAAAKDGAGATVIAAAPPPDAAGTLPVVRCDGEGRAGQGAGGAAAGASSGLSVGGLAGVRRRRKVVVRGAAQHVLQVAAWGAAGASVVLSYSSLASPPATAAVELLPCQPPEGVLAGGGDGTAVATTTAAAAAAADDDDDDDYDYDYEAGVFELRCDGGSDPDVVMQRLWATSYDGLQVPITLCRRRRPDGAEGVDGASGSPPPRPVPLLLRVYGAYGSDPPLDYQPSLLPLLRRDVAVAVAHVRGGGLLGPSWYEGGRGRHKANSHRDLLAVASHLVGCGVTRPELMCLQAESAGGWAAGPALNAAGSALFCAAVLTVPTLDVITSLLEDPSYGPYELGDPTADADLYGRILEWSPYDGLRAGHPYPALLLRIGLYDTNVPYWDPCKYMARLRNLAAEGADPALRVMQVKASGHDAYDTVADDAMRCTFVLWALGAWNPSGPRR